MIRALIIGLAWVVAAMLALTFIVRWLEERE